MMGEEQWIGTPGVYSWEERWSEGHRKEKKVFG